MSDIYTQITERIIKEQEKIIGPIAPQQAKSVNGVTIDWHKHEITITGDEKIAVGELVEKYKELFGKVAVEVCKEAIKGMNISKDQLPQILQ